MAVSILGRGQWGSIWPGQSAGDLFPAARKGVVLHHTVTAQGGDQNSVATILRQIERLDRDTNKWKSSYNFAVDHAGLVYELTGLTRIGTRAAISNTAFWGICFVGDGRYSYPEAAANSTLALVQWLRSQAGHELQVLGHQQVISTACPGGLIQSRIDAGFFGGAVTGPNSGLPSEDGALGPATISALQARLKALGVYNGPIDGTIDEGASMTVMALQRFLNAQGANPPLAVDGAGGRAPSQRERMRHFSTGSALPPTEDLTFLFPRGFEPYSGD